MNLHLDVEHVLPGFRLRVEETLTAPILGVYGPSGAGKSTLLHLIAGLATPARGRIAFGDDLLFDSRSRFALPAAKRRVGLVFQTPRLFPHMTVRRNLAYGMRADAPEAVGFDRVVEVLRLGALLNARPGTLSGGEAQRVTLGRALLASPRLLLLDEACSALDPSLREEVLHYLGRVHREFAVPLLFVSHRLGDLLRLTDTLLLLERGEVRGHGPYADLALRRDAGGFFAGDGLRNLLRARAGRRCDATGVTPLYLAGEGRHRQAMLGPPWPDLAPGDEVLLELAADEIALALAPVEHISIQNQWPMRIRRLETVEHACVCELAGAVPLLARVSRKAAREFALRPGMRVWAMWKANALRCLEREVARGESGPAGDDPSDRSRGRRRSARVRAGTRPF